MTARNTGNPPLTEQAAPYKIELVLDGWAWTQADLNKTIAHLHEILRSHQTPDTGAHVSLVSMKFSQRLKPT